jgi:hypothetical protein
MIQWRWWFFGGRKIFSVPVGTRSDFFCCCVTLYRVLAWSYWDDTRTIVSIQYLNFQHSSIKSSSFLFSFYSIIKTPIRNTKVYLIQHLSGHSRINHTFYWDFYLTSQSRRHISLPKASKVPIHQALASNVEIIFHRLGVLVTWQLVVWVIEAYMGHPAVDVEEGGA